MNTERPEEVVGEAPENAQTEAAEAESETTSRMFASARAGMSRTRTNSPWSVLARNFLA
jgi:hypothetical protein